MDREERYRTRMACRAGGYEVARQGDRYRAGLIDVRTLGKDAAAAILYSAEKATWMAGEAIQCLGGNGYINDSPTGRLWRDAKLYEIGAGPPEIRRILIRRSPFSDPPSRNPHPPPTTTRQNLQTTVEVDNRRQPCPQKMQHKYLPRHPIITT